MEEVGKSFSIFSGSRWAVPRAEFPATTSIKGDEHDDGANTGARTRLPPAGCGPPPRDANGDRWQAGRCPVRPAVRNGQPGER